MVFVDFSKTFDTVGRTRLWQLMRKYGCPEKFTTMIEALHTGMMANVSVGGEVSESFSVTNGVKQGFVLAHALFSIFLSAMLDEAFRDMGDGIYIQSRQSADLFNVAHFSAKTKTTRILTRELLFADDSALVAHSAEEMHKIVDAFSDASNKLGLKINIKKTEVLYQSNSTRTREEDIMVDGNKLNSILEFTYLGSTISSDGNTCSWSLNVVLCNGVSRVRRLMRIGCELLPVDCSGRKSRSVRSDTVFQYELIAHQVRHLAIHSYFSQFWHQFLPPLQHAIRQFFVDEDATRFCLRAACKMVSRSLCDSKLKTTVFGQPE